MNDRQTLILGNERFHVRAWQADPATAYLSTIGTTARPSRAALDRCLDQIRDSGYGAVVTPALHPEELAPFRGVGFVEFDHLRVLAHALEQIPPRPPAYRSTRLRRARNSDRVGALAVDHLAFPPPWQLDSEALDEAIRATPKARFRVADFDGGVVGYAVTGRSGDQAFLQRLAVDPNHHGRGLGSTLVIDALQWATRRRAGRVLVNTQQDNRRALELYRRLGFVLTSTDLIVMRCELH